MDDNAVKMDEPLNSTEKDHSGESSTGEHLVTDHWINDHVLVVNKPAGELTHSPDGKRSGIHERWCEKLGEKLGIHHRLDADTSGLIAFSRSKAGAKALAQAFEERTAKKRYLAVICGELTSTDSEGTPLQPGDTIELKDRLGYSRGRAFSTPGGKHASSRWTLVQRRAPWCLYTAEPITGRTHQLRIQASLRGAPILGDEKYGGGRGPGRMLLHAGGLQLPGPSGLLSFRARPDWAWLNNGDHQPGELDLNALLASIVSKLPNVSGHDEALRLGIPDTTGIPGVKIDRYGPGMVLRVYEGHMAEAGNRRPALEALAKALQQRYQPQCVVVREHGEHSQGARHRERAASEEVLEGTLIEGAYGVTEAGVRHEVALDEDLGCGLYLDQRANRAWVTEVAPGREVLNLFAYTCGFSVAAAVGGAVRTTSVDISQKALHRGQESFRLNGLDPSHHRFFGDDVFEALARAGRRGEKYGLIVCDPPAFSRGKGGVFRLQDDAGKLARLCVSLLEDDGWLLFTVNARSTGLKELRQAVEHAGAPRGIAHLHGEVFEDGFAPLGVGTDLKGVRLQLGDGSVR